MILIHPQLVTKYLVLASLGGYIDIKDESVQLPSGNSSIKSHFNDSKLLYILSYSYFDYTYLLNRLGVNAADVDLCK